MKKQNANFQWWSSELFLHVLLVLYVNDLGLFILQQKEMFQPKDIQNKKENRRFPH